MTTILVVDDSVADQKLAAGLLSKDGWDINFASNGCEAMEALADQQIDLVVTDLQMPKMDGLELVSAAKLRYPLIPVVLMTAAGSEEIAVQALQSGAASYVPKRRLVEELRATVRSVLEAARSHRSNAEIQERVVESHSYIVIETERRMVNALLDHLRGIVQTTNGIEPADHARVGVALEEALTNAYFHGNLEISSELRENGPDPFYEAAERRCQIAPWRDRRIHVTISVSQDRVRFVVRDEGPGFDIRGLPDPTDPLNLARPSGRGVMLMRTFLDEVTFNSRGNEVTLTKVLTHPRGTGANVAVAQ